MGVRIFIMALMLALLGLTQSGCGGGGSSSSAGGGGVGAAPGLSISVLSPSIVMVGLPQGERRFTARVSTPQSQVLVDGQPAPLTVLAQDGTLQVEVDASLSVAERRANLSRPA